MAMAAAAPALAQTQMPPPDAGSTPAQQAGAQAPDKSVEDVEAKAARPNVAAASATDAGEIVVTGKFVDTGAKSAMKMDVRVLDTPFSVQSYSNAFVKSLEVQNISDLYNYMTGLKKSGVTAYDITLRGFKSSGDDRNAIMVDGLPGLTGRYTSPPTIGIDHVELVKGPMSVLYGQIQPGGFVNLITKKPQARQNTTLELRGNTFASKYRSAFDHNGLAGAVDSTGPLFGDNVLYRVVGQITRNDGFRNDAYTHQEYIEPSLAFEITPDTKLITQFEYRHTREHFDIGLAAPFDGATSATSTIYDIHAVAPIATTYTQPDNYRSETGKAADAYLTQGLGGSWKLNASYRHVSYSSDQQDVSSSGVDRYAGELRVTRRARQLQTARHYDYGDVNFSGKFDTFGIENTLIVGVNGGIDQVRENRIKFFNGAARNKTTGICPAGQICLDVALYNPDLDAIPDFDSLPATNPGQETGLTDRRTKSKDYGIYVSDLVAFTDWLKVSWALRKFSEHQETYADRRNQPNNFKEKTVGRNFLPSVGVLLEPSKKITFYASYAESFVPPDPGLIDVNGENNFAPITGKQYEAGIKTQNLMDGRVGFTAAVYRIDQIGQITQTLCPLGSCSVQIGKGRSDGFEFESNVTPVKNWQVIFGYSHIIAKVMSSTPEQSFQVGRFLPNVAKDAANMWTRYDWENGFGVGLGVTYTGQREGVLPTVVTDQKRLILPAYTVVDAGLYYTKEKWSLNLKLGNLLDKKYFENSGAGSQGRVQIQPGQPRYFTLTARVSL
jgi:iron complex outermembrane receptor protein